MSILRTAVQAASKIGRRSNKAKKPSEPATLAEARATRPTAGSSIQNTRNKKQAIVAGAAAAAITGTIGTALLKGSEVRDDTGENGEDANQSIAKQELKLEKSQIDKIVFPLDIEQAPVPHVLIKIFETETGAVERTDLTTQTFFGGAEKAINAAQNFEVPTAIAAAGGGLSASLLARGRAGVVAGFVGAAAGAALIQGGAVGATANGIGQIFGVENTSNRFKDLISNFALKRNIQQLDTAIALLMPETLAVSYQNDYGQPISFTAATGALGLAAQALGSDLGGAGSAANPYIAEAAARLAGGLLTDDFKKIGLFASTGRTINPQLELIYNSPSLREFTMDFRLVPRNQAESATILAILKNLKYYASPQIQDTGGRYFIPPAQFELEFYDADNNQNIFLFKTKKCVLEDISIDYTGNGAFTTFYDGSPTEVRMSLKFRETVIIDREAIREGF